MAGGVLGTVAMVEEHGVNQSDNGDGHNKDVGELVVERRPDAQRIQQLQEILLQQLHSLNANVCSWRDQCHPPQPSLALVQEVTTNAQARLMELQCLAQGYMVHVAVEEGANGEVIYVPVGLGD